MKNRFDLQDYYEQITLEAKIKAQDEMDVKVKEDRTIEKIIMVNQENMNGDREYTINGTLIRIGDLPVFHTLHPDTPESNIPSGSIWLECINDDQEDNILIMTSSGWVDSTNILNGDPIHDTKITSECIKQVIEEYEKRQKKQSILTVTLPSMIAMIYNKQLTKEIVTREFVEHNLDTVKLFISMRIFMIRIATEKLTKLFTEPFIGTNEDHDEAIKKSKWFLNIFWRELMVFEEYTVTLSKKSDQKILIFVSCIMKGMENVSY